MESLSFQLFYRLYRLAHYLLTGVVIRVGNFSMLPPDVLLRLAALPDLWNHYAAAVMRSRVPYEMIALDRGRRYAGESHMRLVTLITHGVSALSVYSDIVGTRLLISSIALFGALLLGAAVVLSKYFITHVAITGWTSSMMGIIIAVFFQNVTMVFVSLFGIVARRSENSFIPARDANYYLGEAETICSAPTGLRSWEVIAARQSVIGPFGRPFRSAVPFAPLFPSPASPLACRSRFRASVRVADVSPRSGMSSIEFVRQIHVPAKRRVTPLPAFPDSRVQRYTLRQILQLPKDHGQPSHCFICSGSLTLATVFLTDRVRLNRPVRAALHFAK